ncbi:MAG: hypothetical protein BMS9Abin05_1086 [Rhodothermia bacterium]|nr:MAG: hypothetical protein BMS9Abin05_1086 [Rhodothermia bacterium]
MSVNLASNTDPEQSSMSPKEKDGVLTAFLESDRGKLLSKWIRWIVSLGVPVLLAIQLTNIGWGEIYVALPEEIVFYVLLLLLFCALPVSETLIYRHAFGVRFLAGLPFFFKKRVYNNDLLNYSGEVYFYLWAEKTFGYPKRRVLGTIKDNNIVSAIASTSYAVAVLAGLLATKSLILPASFSSATWLQILAVVAIVAIAIAAVIKFGHSIFFMPGKSLASFFGIHFGRMTIVGFLQVVQWAVVLPETELSILLTLFAVQIVANRIPMLPVRDLVFLGVSVELTGVLGVSTATVAGMLLVSSVIKRLLNLAVLLFVGLHEARGGLVASGRSNPGNGVTNAGDDQNDRAVID